MKNPFFKRNPLIFFIVFIGLLSTNALFSQVDDLIRKVRENDLNAVKEMIAAGTDVNQADLSDNSPLKVACIESHFEMAKLLIASGADVNLSDTYNGSTPLHWACSSNNAEIVKLLISNGADVNHLDKSDGSPLGSACKRNNIEIAGILISNKADINHIDKTYGYTPLIIACGYGFEELAKLLIYEGADVNIKANDGSTALIHAANNTPGVVDLLLTKGADITARKSDGTGVFTQCIYGILGDNEPSFELADLVLSKGADVDEAATSGGVIGWTPLIYAASNSNANLTRYLIEKGANLNAKTSDGKTALSIALERENEVIVELLKANGAK